MSLQKKLVLVGDGCCGKSYLVITFVTDEFPSFYLATAFKNYSAEVEVDGFTIELSLWDTVGAIDYDKLRSMSYLKTDVILICYSVVDPHSFENVTARWLPEVKRFCPKVPIVLVGTQCDLREDTYYTEGLSALTKRQVTKQEGENLAKKIGALAFIECSAKTKFNVNEVFTTAARATMRTSKIPKKIKDRLCVLM